MTSAYLFRVGYYRTHCIIGTVSTIILPLPFSDCIWHPTQPDSNLLSNSSVWDDNTASFSAAFKKIEIVRGKDPCIADTTWLSMHAVTAPNVDIALLTCVRMMQKNRLKFHVHVAL